MTVVVSDKKTRVESIPYRALWYDNSPQGNTPYLGDVFISGAFNGDSLLADDRELGGIATGRGYGSLIRLTRPYKGDIVECRLTLDAVAGTGSTLVRLYKGDFASDGVFAQGSYSDSRIALDHKALTGRDIPFILTTGDPFFLDGLDIFYVVPDRNASDFNEDGFVLGVEIVTDDFAGWTLNKFKVDCTVQLAEKSIT